MVDDQKTRINFDSLSVRAVDNYSNQYIEGTKTFADGIKYSDNSVQTTAYETTFSTSISWTANFPCDWTTFTNLSSVFSFAFTLHADSKLVIGFTANASADTADDVICFDIAIDGTRQGNANGIFYVDIKNANYYQNVSFTYMSAPLAAGSHTIALQTRLSGSGTANIAGGTSVKPNFYCFELR
jgi:hypothetical protein